MRWPAVPPDPRWRRHALLRVAPAAWAALLAQRTDLAGDALVAGWARRGWPLIVRRRLPGEPAAVPSGPSRVPVGLPLPPAAGRRRIALQVRADDVVSVAPLPRLSAVIATAPPAWQPTLQHLLAVGDRCGAQTRVFGSLAWQWLTGLAYLRDGSDIDLAWTLAPGSDIDAFLAALAGIDAAAPMRIDGELVGADGSGVNWRELHIRSADVLVKTAGEPIACARQDVLDALA